MMQACRSHYRSLRSCRIFGIISLDQLKQLEHADIRKITLASLKDPDRVLEWIFRMHEYVPQSLKKLLLIDRSCKYHTEITGSGFNNVHESKSLRKMFPAWFTDLLAHLKQEYCWLMNFSWMNIYLLIYSASCLAPFKMGNEHLERNEVAANETKYTSNYQSKQAQWHE